MSSGRKSSNRIRTEFFQSQFPRTARCRVPQEDQDRLEAENHEARPFREKEQTQEDIRAICCLALSDPEIDQMAFDGAV